MVKTETIRKGSKVFFADTKTEPVTVYDNLNGEIIFQLKTLVKAQPEELFPVPLDSEIINRCGFFKTDDFVFEHPVEKVEVEIDHRGVTILHFHANSRKEEVQALHELQYYFWKNTNQEIHFK